MSVKHRVRDRAFDQKWMACVLLLLQPLLVTPQPDKRFGPSRGLTVKRNSGNRYPIFFKNFIRTREQLVITPVMECMCQDANRCVLGSLADGIRVELCLKFLNSEEIWQFHSPRRLQVMENLVVPLRQLNIMLHCVLPSAGAFFRTGDWGRNRGRIYHKSNRLYPIHQRH